MNGMSSEMHTHDILTDWIPCRGGLGPGRREDGGTLPSKCGRLCRRRGGYVVAEQVTIAPDSLKTFDFSGRTAKRFRVGDTIRRTGSRTLGKPTRNFAPTGDCAARGVWHRMTAFKVPEPANFRTADLIETNKTPPDSSAAFCEQATLLRVDPRFLSRRDRGDL